MSLIKQQEIAPTIFEDVAGISVQPFKDVCGMIYNNKWLYKSPNVDFNNLVREMTFLDKLYNYEVGANGCLYILFSRRSYYETMAFYNMLKLIFLLLIIIITIISYAPHFAMYISKPILSMIATMSQPLNVSKIYINKHYDNEEIYQLAKEFNTRWLPAKVRTLNKYKSKLLTLTQNNKRNVK